MERSGVDGVSVAGGMRLGAGQEGDGRQAGRRTDRQGTGTAMILETQKIEVSIKHEE